MARRSAIATWLCKCGTCINVIGEVDTDAPLTSQKLACPRCGAMQKVSMDKISSVTEDTDEPFSE